MTCCVYLFCGLVFVSFGCVFMEFTHEFLHLSHLLGFVSSLKHFHIFGSCYNGVLMEFAHDSLFCVQPKILGYFMI